MKNKKQIRISSISHFYNNLKFVRKIQIGFATIALIGTIIAVNDYFQLNNLEKTKDSIFQDYLIPKSKIDVLYSDFQKIQFIMLKFSIEEFADNFQYDIKELKNVKEYFDDQLISLHELNFGKDVSNKLSEVENIWTNYKNLVVDAIVSAAVTRNYEMAAVIATTSGEEVGDELAKKFDEIVGLLSEKATMLDKGTSEDVAFSKLMIIYGIILGAIIFTFFTFLIAPAMTKPIKKFIYALKEFSMGNYDVEIQAKTGDEFGELAEMMGVLRKAQVEKIVAAKQIAAGSFEKVTPASEKDDLAYAFNTVVDTIDKLLEEADMLIQANERGDLSIRGNVKKFSGGWSKIIEGVNSILEASIAPILEASEVLKTMAMGDFTEPMSGHYEGDYELIKISVNKVIDSLNMLIGEVAQSADLLASSASQISHSTEEMAAGANEQDAQTSEVAASIEEIANSIFENTRNANIAVNTAKDAGMKAKNGGEVVIETIEGINRIAEVVVQSSNTIQALGRSSDEIGEIIKVINDIAEQTNLLALNAAIEAARAGEQGRGFAVVADEVRKLAERTTSATKEIESMIKQIQRDTAGAVEVIQVGTAEAEKGKDLAKQAGNSLEAIINHSDKVTEIISLLASASEQQATTGELISKNVVGISNVTGQAVLGTKQISKSAEDLYKLTFTLQELIKRFKLNFTKSANQDKLDSSIAVRTNGNFVKN